MITSIIIKFGINLYSCMAKPCILRTLNIKYKFIKLLKPLPFQVICFQIKSAKIKLNSIKKTSIKLTNIFNYIPRNPSIQYAKPIKAIKTSKLSLLWFPLNIYFFNIYSFNINFLKLKFHYHRLFNFTLTLFIF